MDKAVESMLNHTVFVDKYKQHGEQDTREDRFETPFLWWILDGKPYGYLTCCLRCNRIPFYSNTPAYASDKTKYMRWVKAHEKKGCYEHFHEFRTETGTSYELMKAGKTVKHVTTAVSRADARLYEKPAKKKEKKKETVVVKDVDEETEAALREWELAKYGTPEEGDEPNTISDLINCLLVEYGSLKRMKTDTTLQNEIKRLRAENVELSKRLREVDESFNG